MSASVKGTVIAVDRVAFAQSVEQIRSAAVRNGTDTISMAESDAEVQGVRAARKPEGGRIKRAGKGGFL